MNLVDEFMDSTGDHARAHRWRVTILPKLKKELLTKLGRGNEALDAAWADYREYPSVYTYNDLIKFVPRAEHRRS